MARVARKTEAKDEAQDQIAAMQAQINDLANLVQTAVRNVAPVSRSSLIDSGDMDVPKESVVKMDSKGDASLDVPLVQVPDGPLTKEKAEELAFMDELVEVTVSTTSDQNERQLISVWNDGRHQLFIRGRPVKCKRKFLEVLLRSKPENFHNRERVDESGVRQIDYLKNVSQKYSVSVQDPNPRGADWMRKVLLEP